MYSYILADFLQNLRIRVQIYNKNSKLYNSFAKQCARQYVDIGNFK